MAANINLGKLAFVPPDPSTIPFRSPIGTLKASDPVESDDVVTLGVLGNATTPLKQYGILPWSPLTDYPVNGLAMGLDGLIYQALQESGPGNGGAQSATGGNAYWRLYVAYEMCEVYYFRNPTLRPGFQPCQGGLIANAATLYPDAWAYLQTAEGQLLCKTESAWQAMTTASWGNGTFKASWNGIGGAPFFVQDLVAGTLRLPDLRGMYAEAAGYDSLAVGGVHGDTIRNITGTLPYLPSWGIGGAGSGALFWASVSGIIADITSSSNAMDDAGFDAGRVVPTANKIAPRAWGALACVYLGKPAV